MKCLKDKMRKLFLTILCFFIFNNNVLALIQVDITRGNLEPLPIAVSPFHVESGSVEIKHSDKTIKNIGAEIAKVIEVNFTTSRAILISDLNSNIPVVLEPGSFQSILSGTGKYYGKIKYSKNKLILDDETIVYTSGSGGNFIAGLPVGKINHGIESFAVEFFSDLSQLSYVKIQSIKGQN